MSRIDDLLREHCPEGVEIKPLGQVGQFIRGNGLQKKDFVEEGVGCIHYGQIYTHYGTSATETKSFVTPELAEKLRSAQPGDLVVTTTSENIEDVGKAVAWLGEGPIAIGGHSCSFAHSLDPLYAAFYFQTDAFHRQKRRFVKGTKVKELSTHDLARIEIPVPPTAIQREIVSILTKMEALEAELEAELEARRRQFAFVHNSLLGAHEGVRLVALGELLREPLANGRSVTDGDGYPVLRLTAMRGSVVDVAQSKLGAWDAAAGSRFRIEAGDLLVVRGNGSADLVGRACMVHETDEVAFPDTAIRMRPDLEKVSQHYLYYAWESRSVRDQIRGLAKRSSGVWKVSQDDLVRVQVPVPSRTDQDKVVGVLDAFDALVNGMSSGLPAEIAARRQQYEHYRDRLFDFSRLAA